MRLTDEQINAIRENCLFDEGIRKDLLDTIEAQRQEIELSHQIIDNMDFEYKKLHQENEQLQTQNAQMRNAIYYVLYHLKRGDESWIKDRLEPAIEDTSTDYHNPTDIEALKLAREALDKLKTKFEQYRRVYGSIGAEAMSEVAGEALTAIDKVVEKW
jgi:hypothetical protein